MDVAASLLHLLAFVLPAWGVGLVTALLARWLFGGQRLAWWVHWLAQSVAGSAVLLAGLWFFGHDGKMATYAALVLVCATVQWLLVRGRQAA
jgi:hypothetical protein